VSKAPALWELDLTGRILDDFHVLRRLGQGGMGQVYLAEQRSLKRQIALKILKAELAQDLNSLQRFKAEALAVARATHGNIVQVYAVGEFKGLHYMALEYVDGLNLRDYLARKGPPGFPQALSIMRQASAALARAGELGIVHRDIKPENILLSRKGEVKVADFGLSRCFAPDVQAITLTQTGVTMGTPLYMSPEQVEGKSLDPRSDIYSLGVTCYHMLAGDPPFRGQTAFEVALRHVQTEPDPLDRIRPDLPAELCAIVHKMMAKRPEARYQTGRELLRELNRLRDGLSTTNQDAHPSGLLSNSVTGALASATIPMKAAAAKLSKRNLAYVGAGAVALAACIGAALGWHGRSGAASTARPGAAAIEIPALSHDRKREQFLQAAVKEYEDPKDANQFTLGIGSCLELGEFYLERRQLAEADRFFQGLIDNPFKVKAYMVVGRLGHAMVLAFQDKAPESCQCFLDVINSRDQPTANMRFFLNRNPRFVRLVARALDYNAANLEATKRTLPSVLEELRKPEPLTLFGAAGRRP
jgi:serine/threonine-protein kinase